MAVVEVDVFDVDDPLGTPLGTIDSSEAEAIDFRVGIRGDPGEGHILINRHHSAAALIAPDRIYKVRVPVIGSGYLHAFIQKDARYTLAHPKEQGAETLDLFGPGLKALFSQARLLWQPYAPGQPARGSADHAHNIWWWTGEKYGAIATRVIEEGINQPGTPLADMDITFSRTHDSDGVPWANIADEWQEAVGTDVLSVLGRLEEAGDFYIEVLPDLTVNAYQSYPVRDLTASVHIQKGVNLLTTLKRTIHGRPAITHLELEDSDGNYSLEVDPGWSSGERGNIGYYKASTNDDTTLNKIGQEVIRRSRSSLNPLELEVDPLQLLPGPEGATVDDYWINCEILLSTGTGPQDYDEETVLVTGLRFSLDTAVDDTNATTRRKSLRIVTECNVETINSVSPQAGFGGPVGPHSHQDILCRISTGEVTGYSDVARWSFGTNAFDDATGSTYDSGLNRRSTNVYGLAFSTFGLWGETGPGGSSSSGVPILPNTDYRFSFDHIMQFVPADRDVYVEWWDGPPGVGASALIGSGLQIVDGSSGYSIDTLYQESEVYTSPPTAAYVRYRFYNVADHHFDNLAIELVGTSVDAQPGDGTEEEVGTSIRAARCDHKHHYDDLLDLPDIPDTSDFATDAEVAAAIAAIDFESAGYWEPVTNGNVASPEIVFDAGDVVMEWVP